VGTDLTFVLAPQELVTFFLPLMKAPAKRINHWIPTLDFETIK
jgi:hypothetical protein